MEQQKNNYAYITCTKCGKLFSKIHYKHCCNCFACTGCEIYYCPYCNERIEIVPVKKMPDTIK